MSSLGVRNGLERATAHLAREADVLADVMKIRFYPFVLARADGCRLTDIDGNDYLDFCAAGAVLNVGYRNEHVATAVEQALSGPWSTTSAIFAHEAQSELARRLTRLVPGEMKTWFGTSGSEAMDTIARYLRTASGRPRLVAFANGFHGQTGGSGAISGLPAHSDYPSAWVTKVPYPYPYRCAHGPCDPDGCSLACLRPLEQALSSQGTLTAGILLEPIQSDGGDVVPPTNVLPALRRLADEHGAWLAVDEVKVGLGRTGQMLAVDHTGVVPDAVGLGKSLGGGLPISAAVARREILDAGVGTCAITLAGSPAPCAAALAVLDELERLDPAGARGRARRTTARRAAGDRRRVSDRRRRAWAGFDRGGGARSRPRNP